MTDLEWKDCARALKDNWPARFRVVTNEEMIAYRRSCEPYTSQKVIPLIRDLKLFRSAPPQPNDLYRFLKDKLDNKALGPGLNESGSESQADAVRSSESKRHPSWKEPLESMSDDEVMHWYHENIRREMARLYGSDSRAALRHARLRDQYADPVSSLTSPVQEQAGTEVQFLSPDPDRSQ